MSDELAQEVLEERQCRFDAQTKQLVIEHGRKPGHLRGRVPMAILAHRAKKLSRRCILRLESLHASFRRRARLRGVNSSGEDFTELAADWVIDRARKRKDTNVVIQAMPKQIVEPEASSCGGYQRAPNPWNLFMREKFLGSQAGRPSVKTIKAEYKELTDEERSELVKRCNDAKDATQHRFGLNSRDRLRKEQQSLLEVRKRNLLGVMNASDLGASVEDTATVTAAIVTHNLQHPGLDTVAKMVAAVKADMTALSAIKRQRRIADQQCVVQWSASNAEAKKDLILKAMPQLQPFSSALVPVPDCHMDTCLEFVGQPLEAASLGLSLSSENTTGKAMVDDSTSMCLPIMHDDCEPLSEACKADSRGKPKCNTVTLCLCSERGSITYKMRNAFLRQMKHDLGSDVMKNEVDDLRVFARLHGHRPASFTVTSAADADLLAELEALGMQNTQAKAETIWYCLGNHNWSPYKSTYKLMTEDTTSLAPRLHADEIFLKASIVSAICYHVRGKRA